MNSPGKQHTQRAPYQHPGTGYRPIHRQTPRIGRLVRLWARERKGRGIGALTMTNRDKEILDAYNFHRARGARPDRALQAAKARVRAEELELGAAWAWDELAETCDDDGCLVARRIEAGYTDGRQYRRWVYRARYGRYPHSRKQAGEYVGPSARWLENDHRHEYLVCTVALENDIDRGTGDLRPGAEHYTSLSRIADVEVSAWRVDDDAQEIQDNLFIDAVETREAELAAADDEWIDRVMLQPVTG